jgi:type IV pilus assembly protein PilP
MTKRRKRREEGERSRGDSLYPLIWGFLFLFFLFGDAFAAQEVAYQDLVYKEARPKKNLFGEDQSLSPTQMTKFNEDYRYDPAGKQDPFKPFIIALQQALEEEKEKERPRTYLETLDLSQLDLIAIILNPKGNYAMVRDAKGTGHVIRKGTPIGINRGTVTAIKDKVVVITEKRKNLRGQVKTKTIKKKLPSLE